MPFESSMASVLRITGELLTLKQRGAASTNTTTQVTTYGPEVNTPTYGMVTPVFNGTTEVATGDLHVYLPKVQLDAENVTPVVGDYLVQANGTALLILELETQFKAGFYRARARV